MHVEEVVAAGILEYVPLLHAEHDDEPMAAVKWPVTQSVHVLALVASATADALPAGHEMHDEEAAGAYEPLLQAEHEVDAVDAADRPATQSAHVLALVAAATADALPAAQPVQVARAPVAGAKVPWGHDEQPPQMHSSLLLQGASLLLRVLKWRRPDQKKHPGGKRTSVTEFAVRSLDPCAAAAASHAALVATGAAHEPEVLRAVLSYCPAGHVSRVRRRWARWASPITSSPRRRTPVTPRPCGGRQASLLPEPAGLDVLVGHAVHTAEVVAASTAE